MNRTNNFDMSFYTCFDWFKKLRLFVNEQNLRIDIVLKTSRAVVIMCFSLNEAPLGLFKFILICHHRPYLICHSSVALPP
jgi:hypothetical protein